MEGDVMRATAAYVGEIDLAQLDEELGGHGLCAGDGMVCVAEGSPVTQQELEAAIAAHVPPPPPPTREEAIDALPDPTVDFEAFKAALKDVPPA